MRRRGFVHLALLSAGGVAALASAADAWALNVPPPVGTPAPRPKRAPAKPGQPQTLEWEDLLPKQARQDFSLVPPPALHDYLSGEQAPGAPQRPDFRVNAKLDGQLVRLPGFLVPLELDAQGRVTELFLVPYFGACIHVPPPPPNQIVYVSLTAPFPMDSLYNAYWVTGRMTVQRRRSTLAHSAYTVAATRIDEYR